MIGVRPLAAASVVAALVLAGFVRAADAPAWTVDYAKSSIAFAGKQMGVPSQGKFKKFSATINFDRDAPETSKVDVTIDIASVESGNRDIDAEIKKPVWFDVQRFPTARFVTTAIRAKGGKAYEASGKLTIRDVTRDVVLPFAIEIGSHRSDPTKLLARAQGEVTVSRLAFGIGQNEWKDTRIVADAVTIRIDITAHRIN